MKSQLILGIMLLFVLCISGNAFAVSEQSLFGDNFNDGSIADWDQNSGTWSAATFQLVGGTTNPAYVSHTVSGLTAGRSYRFYYKNDPNVGSLENNFYWFTDNNGGANVSGYNLTLSSTAGTLKVFRNGVVQNLANVGSVTIGSMHDINITHTFDGNIQVFVDNSLRATVIDTNFNSGSKIMFGTDNTAGAGKFDDVNVFFIGDTNTAFKVVDEETTSIGLQATMTINGVSWPVNQYGNFDVNSSITFPATISISMAGYDDRTFYFDTNAGLYLYPRFGLRNSSEAKTIDFTFYSTDETTLLPNNFVRVIKNGVNAGSGLTNSDAFISYNLAAQDSGYRFLINIPGSDTNTLYTYTPVSVTVLRPIDERTLLSINKIWSVSLGGLGAEYQDANNSSKSFTILGNTTRTYDFFVDDSNTVLNEYFPSNYSVNYKGDTNVVSIQPYLLNLNDGSEVTFIVYDKFTNNTVSDVLVNSYRSITGTSTLVRSALTNGTGLVTFGFINSINYDITVLDSNQSVTYFPDTGKNGQFNNTFSTYNIFITISNVDINTTNHNWNIIVNPYGDTITPNATQYFDANITTDYADSIETIYYDGNTILSDSITIGQDKNTAIVIDTTLTQSDFVSIKIVIRKDFQQDVYIQTWKIVDTNSSLGQGFLGVTNNLGVFGGLIILLAIIFMALQQFGPNLFGNNESQMFLVGLIMVGGGVLLFPGNLFPILVALTFGVIIYLQLRAS